MNERLFAQILRFSMGQRRAFALLVRPDTP